MASRPKPVLLLILDGWGHRDETADNAIALARVPHWRRLLAECPHTLVHTEGRFVGLPDGQMGNSEVGHMNIGAGRIVYQDLTRVDAEIESGDFYRNAELLAACHAARDAGGTLHLMGLLSPGGVHSHEAHLFALIEMAKREGVARVAVHAFLDGRDMPPKSAEPSLRALADVMAKAGNAHLASVSGRYFAMDRDKRWERTQLAWDAIVLGIGEARGDAPSAAVAEKYGREETDEFLKPLVFGHAGERRVRDGDVILFFNFRADRARQLSHALLLPNFDGFLRGRVARDLHVVTLSEYEVGLPVAGVAFPPQHVHSPLARVVSDAGLRQCHVAETEKYAHVTFFLNGGVEEPFPGEDRLLVQSPKVATYDLKPDMSAAEVARVASERIATHDDALVVLNFANGDMVGHTGVMAAAQAAVAAVDEAVGVVVAAARALGRIVVITSDHGNAEMMIDPATGGAWTAHTTNPVPLIIVGAPAGAALRPRGDLSNVAPTVLQLMGLPVPPTMTSPDLLG